MKKAKRHYQKPAIASERVFEQAALACTHNILTAAAPPPIPNMKMSVTICGYNSS